MSKIRSFFESLGLGFRFLAPFLFRHPGWPPIYIHEYLVEDRIPKSLDFHCWWGICFLDMVQSSKVLLVPHIQLAPFWQCVTGEEAGLAGCGVIGIGVCPTFLVESGTSIPAKGSSNHGPMGVRVVISCCWLFNGYIVGVEGDESFCWFGARGMAWDPQGSSNRWTANVVC